MGYMLNPLLKEEFQKKQKFSFVYTTESGDEIDIIAAVTGLQDDLARKVDKDQGLVNAGKILTVNEMGIVTTTSGIVFTPADRQDIADLKKVTYGIDTVSTEASYLKSYQLFERDASGKKTYLGEKINIPRDFFLKSVRLVEVTDSAPVAGYENGNYFEFTFVVEDGAERVEMLSVANLKPMVLYEAEHIRIQDDYVSAVDFVPQYDNVAKVLPGENQFQYIGPTTPDGKWVQDYFYRLKEIEKPIYNPQTYHFGVGTDYIDVVKDGYQFPKGRYYEVSIPPASEVEAGKTYWTLTPYVNNGNDLHYQSAQAGTLRIGDRVWTYGDYSESTRFYTIEEIGYSNIGYVRWLRLSNGETIYVSKADAENPFRRMLVSEKGDKMYYVAGSNIWYFSGDLTHGYIGTPRENTDPDISRNCLYHDGLGWVPGSAIKGKLAEASDVTVNYVTYAGVYDWVQIDVQPQGIPAELESKIHDQNTDTALDTDKLVVSADSVTINKDLQLRANRAEFGKYGTADNEKKYLLKVGNGTADTASDAAEMDYNGEAHFARDVSIGGTFDAPEKRLSKALFGEVCTFEKMMQHYVPGNGMIYMIYE